MSWLGTLDRHSVRKMRESQGMQASRNALAASAVESAGANEIMTIQCPRSHHLARVFQTSEGMIIEANLNRRSHGRRDLHSDPHGVDEASLWWDFVDPGHGPAPVDPAVDDMIPVGCACGDRLLSRSAIADWITEHTPRVIVD